jgi:hypothetical protein
MTWLLSVDRHIIMCIFVWPPPDLSISNDGMMMQQKYKFYVRLRARSYLLIILSGVGT